MVETLAVQLSSLVPSAQLANTILHAGHFVEKGTGPLEAMAKLGLSGSIHETLATTVYCVMNWPESPLTGLVSAVVNGGDTDTRAAIVGAIWGAHRGEKIWPKVWLERLPGADTVRRIALQLCKVVTDKKAAS